MKNASLAALFLCVACEVFAAEREDILFGPHINHTSETATRIVWVAEKGFTPALSLGESSGRIRLATRPISNREELLYVATVSGLEPGTRYTYELQCGRDQVRGSFHTALPPDTEEPFRFVVYGDTRSVPLRHLQVVNSIRRDLPLAFVVHTGDLIANGDLWQHWIRDFFTPARALLPETTIWPIRGNHEGNAVWLRDLFELPGNELYYSFDYGNLHVVVLDTTPRENARYGAPDSAPAEMLAWLEQDLTATDATWILAAYHAPTFNIGGHASRWGQDDVLPILEKHGVDLVVAGHSHIYERFRPIGPRGGKPIIHVVSGGGGAPTYTPKPSPILAQSSDLLHHALFTIRGDQLKMVVRSPAGEMIDRLTLKKGADGLFQEAVMRDMLETTTAQELSFVSAAALVAKLEAIPQAGRAMTVPLSVLYPLPPNCTITVSSASESDWEVEPATFPFDRKDLPVTITPPDHLDTSGGTLEPPLVIRFDVRDGDKLYEGDNLSVGLTEESIRVLNPPPPPVIVPKVAGPFTVDGDLAEWKDVAPPVSLDTGQPSKVVRLAWNANGLYVAVHMKDDHLEDAAEGAWTSDGMELFLETDAARSDNALENPHASKSDLVALPDSTTGEAVLRPGFGRLKEQAHLTRAAWRPVQGGYTMELFLPAEVLKPATMTPGSRMSFHYAAWNDGKRVESFVNTEGKKSVFRKPCFWGIVELGDE